MLDLVKPVLLADISSCNILTCCAPREAPVFVQEAGTCLWEGKQGRSDDVFSCLQV